MKKILLLLLAVVLALTVVCVPSFAEEVDGVVTEPAEEETAVDEELRHPAKRPSRIPWRRSSLHTRPRSSVAFQPCSAPCFCTFSRRG